MVALCADTIVVLYNLGVLPLTDHVEGRSKSGFYFLIECNVP